MNSNNVNNRTTNNNENMSKKINKNNWLLGVSNNNSDINKYSDNDIVKFLSDFKSNNSSNLPQYNKGSTNNINQIQQSYNNVNKRMNIQQKTKRNNFNESTKKSRK